MGAVENELVIVGNASGDFPNLQAPPPLSAAGAADTNATTDAQEHRRQKR